MKLADRSVLPGLGLLMAMSMLVAREPSIGVGTIKVHVEHTPRKPKLRTGAEAAVQAKKAKRIP